ncbi:MAG: CpsB/CapC family capsule biosynthesis tyrosine phosphatase [Bacteroidia bacterium]
MGILNFLKKQPTPPELPQEELLVDIHSHLIPGIDDGAKNMERALQMAASMKKLGYKKLITTPHITGDFFRNTPEIILGGLSKLNEAIKQEGIDIEVEAAAEYYLDEWFMEKLNAGPLLTMGKKYLLVETSYWNEPAGFEETIFQIQVAGYKPVLAHPERYIFMQEDFSRYEKLLEKKVLFQINLLSLTKYYSPEAKLICEKLIDAGMAHFAGSDIHTPRHIPRLKEAMTSKYFRKLCKLPLLNNTLA